MKVETASCVELRRTAALRMQRIARVQARLDQLRAVLSAELEAVQARHAGRISEAERRLATMLGELEKFCRSNRDALLPAGRKSLTTPFGQVAFRRAEVSIRLRDGLSDAEVCRMLRQAGLDQMVRMREAPDRAALRRALAGGRVSPDTLRVCGLEPVGGAERFHCKLSRDALARLGRAAR